jgi:hypothetical protein
LKKPTGFGFLSQEPEKPNRTEKKPEKNRAKPKKTSQTEPNWKNRAKPVWTGFFSKKPNRTEPKPVQFEPVSVRFRFFFLKKNNSVWLLFFIKTEPNRTVNTPSVFGIVITDMLWFEKYCLVKMVIKIEIK